MLSGGETVLVGVSGGADSVALLHVLSELADSLPLKLSVLHVHHGLRPEADDEARFVERLGEEMRLPVIVERVTVERSLGLSPEAAMRRARYAAFRLWAERSAASRVALGHTADDQAETVLMRLLQGAGPRGLAGIPPVRGPYIRPLIETGRGEILKELQARNLPWVEDPSNRDPKFLRNRLRHDLLPLLAGGYNPRIVEALCRVAALSRSLVESLDRAAEREMERLAVASGSAITLPEHALLALPQGIGASVLRLALLRLGATGPLRGWPQRVFDLLLGDNPPSGQLRLGGIVVERGSGRIRLARGEGAALPERPVPIPGAVKLPEAGLLIEAKEFSRPAGYTVSADREIAAFDRDRLPGPLTLRSRRPGDRFAPFGLSGSKRLKKFLIDTKVPRWERSRVPLLAAGGEILWVVGLRRSSLAPVTPETCRVVEVTARPLGEHERAE
jgi:tRNA(Ile)-lysidine synthase